MSARSPKAALANALKRQILTLARAPGADIDETQLCTEFGLSRTPVREVFRELDGLGYLQMRQQRAPKVSDLNHVTLRSFFLAAPMIYAAVLRLAASNRRSDQIDALREAQIIFVSSLRSGGPAERTLANYRFHEITGEMAASVYLLPSFHRLLIDHARIGMTFYQPQTRDAADDLSEASAQHEAIIEAIAARDEDAAAQLAEDHWALSRSRMSQFLMPDALSQPLGQFSAPKTA